MPQENMPTVWVKDECHQFPDSQQGWKEAKDFAIKNKISYVNYYWTDVMGYPQGHSTRVYF